jgi:hypothetical protein
MRQTLAWAAMAASLLVAFSLGMLFPRGSNLPPAYQTANSTATRGEAVDDHDPDSLTVYAHDAAGQRHALRVPLMDASTLDRQLGVQFRSGMPPAVRDRLRDGGYHVQSRRRYAPLWLENGQQMVLPVEDTKIVPVSQNVF